MGKSALVGERDANDGRLGVRLRIAGADCTREVPSSDSDSGGRKRRNLLKGRACQVIWVLGNVGRNTT